MFFSNWKYYNPVGCQVINYELSVDFLGFRISILWLYTNTELIMSWCPQAAPDSGWQLYIVKSCFQCAQQIKTSSISERLRSGTFTQRERRKLVSFPLWLKSTTTAPWQQTQRSFCSPIVFKFKNMNLNNCSLPHTFIQWKGQRSHGKPQIVD